MKVLVINAGSSSLKYQIIDSNTEQMLGKGNIERIGVAGSSIKNHTDALRLMVDTVIEKGIIKDINEISAVGHRVVHSGEDFTESVVITKEVMDICKKNIPLAPLHQPANIACIESCLKLLPNAPSVAVFDTAFHATMPKHAYMYAIDYADYEKYKIRKYGFHGTSHKYVSTEAIRLLGKQKSKIITCHLGNGSSMAAVVDGKCIDTTMGLTPLEGLIMGTRSGDIDPAVIPFLMEQKGMTAEAVTNYLNKQCGFLGISGLSDSRDISAKAFAGDERAKLTIEMFAYRIKKYIGAYSCAMGGLDAIVFAGGIGENGNEMREPVCRGLEGLGVKLDYNKNNTAPRGQISEIQAEGSKVKIFIIPTNEELVIARDVKRLVGNN
jgi:acetate kinase